MKSKGKTPVVFDDRRAERDGVIHLKAGACTIQCIPESIKDRHILNVLGGGNTYSTRFVLDTSTSKWQMETGESKLVGKKMTAEELAEVLLMGVVDYQLFTHPEVSRT